MRAALGAVLTAVVLAGCGVGVTSLEDFRSAVRSGANCAELWDQRSNFTDAETLEQIDAVRSLTKTFGRVRAVDDLSFTAGWGRVTGFLGPNGAGKTTTLRMLLGLIGPTGGEALIDGAAYRHMPDPARAVGSLLETQQFHPRRRARAHLRVLAAALGLPDSRVDEVLDAVDLARDADRRVGQFSLGMRQRLGLAAALLGDPRILVLDEPANGLDPAGIRWLRSALRDFADAGGAVLVSSHQLREVAAFADDLVVINHGRLIRQAPVGDLLDSAGTDDLEDAFLNLTSPETS